MDTAVWAERLGSGKWWRRGQSQPTDREIARAKTLEGARVAQTTVNNIVQALSFLPKAIVTPLVRIYISAQEYALNTSPAQVAPMGLIGVMGVVFLGWRIRALEPWMRKWWLHRPVLLNGTRRGEWANCLTLFTSTVSARIVVDLTTCSSRINHLCITVSIRLLCSLSAQPLIRISPRQSLSLSQVQLTPLIFSHSFSLPA